MNNNHPRTTAEADALREALWICVEHNALHFGETHNTVVQGRAALATAAAAVPAIPDAITHTIQRALVKFSDSELERLRTLLGPENAAVAMFGVARIAAQQNIDDADAALNWLAAAPKAASATGRQAMTDTTPAPIGADAALALLVAAVEAETDPSWECTSYHPSLWSALSVARAAPATAAQPPADGALNTIAAMFHGGEEIEGPDGLAIMVDMALWNDALDAFEGIIGDEKE